MNNPLRYWRTGAIAVVMAALGQAGGAAGRETEVERTLVRRQSPYNVTETVLRIEGSARERGLPVFARVEPGPAAAHDRAPVEHVIVLESSQGGTPVLMGAASGKMELPLSVIVRRSRDGGTEVLIGVARDWDAMPSALALDMAQLTAAVGDALKG
jgi:uncharacterized protein (DUF302 family)